MGRITDGSCNIFTKDNPYIVQQNPYKVDNTAAYVNMGMNAFTGILGSILNGSKNTDGSDKTPSSVDTKTPKELKSEINAILDQYDSNPGDNNVDANISDLELKLAEKKNELQQLQQEHTTELANLKVVEDKKAAKSKELNGVTKEYDKKSAKLANVTATISQNNAKIDDYKVQIKNLQSLSGNDNKDSKIEELKADIRALEEENKKLTAEQKELETEVGEKGSLTTQKANLEGEINTLNNEISTLSEKVKTVKELDNEIQNIEVDLKKLDDLKKQLKKAEGKDAIENLTNDETGDITKLIKKLNKAKTPEEKAACQKAVKDALEVYYTKHKQGDNKTIDSLCEIYMPRNGAVAKGVNLKISVDEPEWKKISIGI